MSTCKEPGCYAWTDDDVCTLHRAEKAEARVAELEAALFRVMSWDTGALTCSDCTKRTRSRFDDPTHELDCGHLRDRNAGYKLLGRLDCVANGYEPPDSVSVAPECPVWCSVDQKCAKCRGEAPCSTGLYRDKLWSLIEEYGCAVYSDADEPGVAARAKQRIDALLFGPSETGGGAT